MSTVISKIKAELERLKDTRAFFDDNCQLAYWEGLHKALSFIESLEREHVPKNAKTGTQEPRKGLHPHSLRKIENPMAWMENDEIERKAPKIKGWIARDEDGELYLYDTEPWRDENLWQGRGRNEWELNDNNLFPNLKWEDEPIEVELTLNCI